MNYLFLTSQYVMKICCLNLNFSNDNSLGTFYLFIYLFLLLLFFTLQYCIGFAIHQHASTMGVHGKAILKRFSLTHLKSNCKNHT